MKRYLRRIGALLMATIMVLSMCLTVLADEGAVSLTPTPTPSGVTPTKADTAIATVENVEETAIVTAYQIVKADYNTSGFIGYVKANDSLEFKNLLEPTSDEITTIAKNVTGLEKKTMNKVDQSENNGLASFSAPLNPGIWMVLVSGTVDEVYNPMIVSVYYCVDGSNNNMSSKPVDANSNWTLETKNAYAKSTKPKITKTIVSPGSGNEKGDDVAYGDTINYKIDTAIPSYSKEYEKVTVEISDVLSSGLKLKKDEKENYLVTVKVDEKEVSKSDNTYTFDATDNGFTLKFISDYALKHSGSKVEITYSATLNEGAPTNFDANTNTATIRYSNNPKVESSTKNVTDKTYHYTFAIDSKLRGSDTKKTTEIGKYTSEKDSENTYTTPLSGAKFTLTNDKTKKVYTETSDANGRLEFKGLDAGEYTLVETVAPKGYTVSTETHSVVITADYDTTGILKSYTIKIDGKATSTYTAIYEKDEVKEVTGESKETQIPNTEIGTLPSTGGMGIYLFTITGVMIMAAVTGMFLVSRRKEHENQ